MAIEIKSARDGSTLTFSDPRSRAEGFVTFTASLQAQSLSATVEVENFGIDGLVSYFSEIASEWRGWKGAKTYEFIEGQLLIESTSDTSGHVFLKASLRDDLGGADWLASGVFFLEAGLLQQIATDLQKLRNVFAMSANQSLERTRSAAAFRFAVRLSWRAAQLQIR